MIPNGEYTAVVDRIEDGLATLEVSGDDEAATADERYELVVEPSALPEEARHADAICEISVFDGDLTDVVYRPEETEARHEEAQDRFDRLSSRPPRNEDETDNS